MRSSFTFRAVGLALVFTISVTAQNTNKTLTSTGCQDANSFTTCSETAAGKGQVCQSAAVAADSALDLAACGCVYYIEMMNCYMASCWNRVSNFYLPLPSAGWYSWSSAKPPAAASHTRTEC